MIEAQHQACMAEEYDLAVNIIGQFNLYDLLDLWGNSRTLIEIYEKLLPEDHFNDEPLLKNKQIHGAVLGNLGTAYRQLGEPKKRFNIMDRLSKFRKK